MEGLEFRTVGPRKSKSRAPGGLDSTPQEVKAHAILPARGPWALALPAPTCPGPQAGEEEGHRHPNLPINTHPKPAQG